MNTPFVCGWCGFVHDPEQGLPCPCIRDEDAVAEARSIAKHRHHHAVAAARRAAIERKAA